MLRELHIINYAIIDEVSLEFSEGLNIITGETGAGKSILIDALSVILGGRSSPDLVREGKSEATLEARFDPLESAPSDLPSEEWLILKRVLSKSGKNKTYLNNSFVNVSTLKEIGRKLTEIHGQHEHHNLLSLEWQLHLLDAFGRLTPLREDYTRCYRSWSQLQEEQRSLQKLESEGRQKQSFLEYQLSEIREAAFQPGEEETLEREEKTLQNWEAILSTAEKAYALLAGEEAMLNQLDEIGNAVKKLQELTDDASDEIGLWETSKIQLKELSVLLRNRTDQMEYDPARLGEIRERLYLMQKLKKKYGRSFEELLKFQKELEEELSKISGCEAELIAIQKHLDKTEKTLSEKAKNLSRERNKIKAKLEAKVKEELFQLGMERTQFEAQLTEKALSEDGSDKIEYLIALPGEIPHSLASVASGGELSRIMLALKVVLTEVDPVGVLIFDEVDAGIGGAVAEKVGKRLSKLASSHQVLCITHLPQIARFADHHYFVEKRDSGGRVITSIKELSTGERVHELARMLGGATITPITLRHAEEMIGIHSPKGETILSQQTRQSKGGHSK
ncbi:MAG: DNA repair protein RecN [Nitrospirae bacterium]|nr:DNA repair protein RecN [Candidatus Manganitrophaceae bacterium]